MIYKVLILFVDLNADFKLFVSIRYFIKSGLVRFPTNLPVSRTMKTKLIFFNPALRSLIKYALSFGKFAIVKLEKKKKHYENPTKVRSNANYLPLID